MKATQFLSFIFIMAISHSLSAQVYKCENDAGDINFSDEPCARGETAERLNWLKGATGKKHTQQQNNKPRKNTTSQAKRTAQKAKENKKAYVLLSLLTTTQLELETATLRSSLNGVKSDAPELLLSDGITVDFLTLDKMLITYKLGDESLQVRFIMADGYEEVKTIHQPYPLISGAARIGSFSKSLQDIKQIQFFNSGKLRAEAEQQTVRQNRQSVSVKKKTPARKETSPVVELDLSYQLSESEKKQALAASHDNSKSTKTPVIRVSGRSGGKNIAAGDSKPEKNSAAIEVNFVNDNKISLQREMLSSTKGAQKSRPGYFLLADKQQIPYQDISSIKIRPTSKQLLVAVKLKTKEIKMEVMSPPFTRIIGHSSSGKFDYSLLEIKAINF